MFPGIESLQEVKVQVHTYDAEMGRTGGGVFNATGRSGSNQWHGNGFVQDRPVWGATNGYFADGGLLPLQWIDIAPPRSFSAQFELRR